MNDSFYQDENRDEELDELFQKITGEKDHPSIEEVKRARKALQLIERVRRQEQDETGANPETIADPKSDESQSSEATEELPEAIGRFKLIEVIGRGGFGVVFRATDPNLNREVALKVARPETIATADSRLRFVREGQAAASLSHPNIVPVYESGHNNSGCFIASEYIQGTSLDSWRETNGKISNREAAEISCSIAEAVGHAHRRGIIHRDIKPAIILIGDSAKPLRERVKITDFGLAKMLDEEHGHTLSGALIGTPSFMATEQARQQEATAASDIYSVGAVLYWLLTGKPPHSKPTVIETISSIVADDVIRPRKIDRSIPADLESICLKCLEKKSLHRYSTADDLQKDLERFLRGEPVAARTVGPVIRTIRWCGRNMLATALILVLAISSITVAALLVRSEDLRSVSASRAKELKIRSEQLQTRTNQLQETIQNLFLVVAQSPEIMAPGNDSLRKKLIEQADRAYSKIEFENPDSHAFSVQKQSTKLKYSKLCFALNEKQKTIELVAELLSSLNERLNVETDQAQRFDLLQLLVETMTLQLIVLATEDATEIQQSELTNEIIQLVDGELANFHSIRARLSRAIALAEVASNRMLTSATDSVELSDRARDLWLELSMNQ